MIENIKNNAILAVAGFTAMLMIAAILIFGPILVIWSLNILFPVLTIPYTLETWAAIVILFLFSSFIFKNSKG
jgi:hypothetical protein